MPARLRSTRITRSIAVERLPDRAIALPSWGGPEPGWLPNIAWLGDGVAEATDTSDSLSYSTCVPLNRAAAARFGTSLLVVIPPSPLRALFEASAPYIARCSMRTAGLAGLFCLLCVSSGRWISGGSKCPRVRVFSLREECHGEVGPYMSQLRATVVLPIRSWQGSLLVDFR